VDYHLNLATSFAAEVARRGWVAWNIEYRRVGANGGWPQTFDDVTAAVGALRGAVGLKSGLSLDLDRVQIVGHSAGGQLALWYAGESDAPIRPQRVVAQAGALDLVAAGTRDGGHSWLAELLGGSYEEVPHRYEQVSPMHRLPLGVPVTCIHGARDAQIPAALSKKYCARADEAGDIADLVVVEGEGHNAFLDRDSQCWAETVKALRLP
jgi:acetyl esterase/lipase